MVVPYKRVRDALLQKNELDVFPYKCERHISKENDISGSTINV